MKTTGEIDKQLEAKADKFINEASKEIADLIVAKFSKETNRKYDWLYWYKKTEGKEDHDMVQLSTFKDNLNSTLKRSFREDMVRQYTKVLLAKLDILE